MRRLLFLSIIFGFAIMPLVAQTDEPPFASTISEKVSTAEVAWTWKEGVYDRKDGPHTVFLLLNTGGAVDPRLSANFRELVKSWLGKHTAAEAFVVGTIPGVSSHRGWTFKPVLVADRDDVLNIYLVRQGACPYHFMVPSQNSEWGVPLTSAQIRTLQKRLAEAELQARKEKLGIWAEPDAK